MPREKIIVNCFNSQFLDNLEIASFLMNSSFVICYMIVWCISLACEWFENDKLLLRGPTSLNTSSRSFILLLLFRSRDSVGGNFLFSSSLAEALRNLSKKCSRSSSSTTRLRSSLREIVINSCTPKAYQSQSIWKRKNCM